MATLNENLSRIYALPVKELPDQILKIEEKVL